MNATLLQQILTPLDHDNAKRNYLEVMTFGRDREPNTTKPSQQLLLLDSRFAINSSSESSFWMVVESRETSA